MIVGDLATPKLRKDDLKYALGRAYLYVGNYERARELLSEVPTSFGYGVGNKALGRARILEAAALVGLVNREKDLKNRTNLIFKAKELLSKGRNQDKAFWDGIFIAQKRYIHEGFKEPVSILKNLYAELPN